jgi:hypothetical protein
MKISHDDLKEVYKSYIRGRVPASRKDCPTTEKIFGLLEEPASAMDKDGVINHIISCSYCLQEFEFCLSFLRGEEKAVEEIMSYFGTKGRKAGIPDRRHKVSEFLSNLNIRAHPSWKWAAVSLTAIILAGLFLITIRFLTIVQEDEERGRPPGEVRLISPLTGKKVSPPLVFRWQRVSAARYYQLEIFDKSLLSLWKSPQVESTHYQLTTAELNLIKQNEVCYWAITAWLIDGTKRESPLEEFRLRE